MLLRFPDWRVDVKSASNHLSHMAVPTVLVDMKVRQRNRGQCTRRDEIASRCDSHVMVAAPVFGHRPLLTLVHRSCCLFACMSALPFQLQPPPTSTRLIAPLESFNFELSPAALTTLLSGLERIQTQLSSMK